MDYHRHQNCPLCGKGPLRDIKGYERHFLARCMSCSFVCSARIPTQQELTDHYSAYTYTSEHYLSPITIRRYHELLDEFEPYRKTNRLLDVGCGLGFFLVEAAKRGWEVYGTEFSDAGIRVCESKGIRMKQGELNAKDWPEDYFDVVTSFEVLEHLVDPVKEITQVKPILRKDGLFYATTPNFDALTRYVLKADYNIIIYPEHLSYFTVSTLNKLLSGQGFEKLKVQVTGISFTRINQACFNSDQKLISEESDDEKVRKKIEGNPLLRVFKKVVNGMLTITRTGLSLKVYYLNRK